MKVLIISDNEKNINFIDSFMTSKGYDVITYKWLIKAIDNIEEIKPNIIIISSGEYPRHWKTLASYVQSGIGGDNIKLYLYEPEPLSQEDVTKAKTLGIEGFLTGLDNESFNKYFPDNINENQHNTEKNINSQIILTDPLSGSLLSGKVIKRNDNCYECKIDSHDLEPGVLINEISINSQGNITFCSANVKEENKEQGTVSLWVSEYYGEI